MYDHVCLCDTSSDGARPYGKVVSDFPPLGEGSLSRSYVIDLGWAQDVISGVTCQSLDLVMRLRRLLIARSQLGAPLSCAVWARFLQ